MNSISLSIITINFNNRTGLADTIKSVLNQSFTNYEYIIIDGGSTDGSKELILEYERKFDYWVSETDRGIYHAMNKGIKEANGVYCMFLNSGDCLHTTSALESIPFDEKIDFVCGNLIGKDPENPKKLILNTPPDKIDFRHLYLSSLPHPASFIRKEIFNKIGVYREEYKLVSDWILFFEALVFHNCSYTHINKTISVFNLDGVSSLKENESLVQNERQRYFREAFTSKTIDFINQYFGLEKEISELRSLRGLRSLMKINNLIRGFKK